MTAVLTLEQDLVFQDVDNPTSLPALCKVDLAIPAGKAVVGSGAVVTHVWDAVTESYVPVDSADPSVVAGQLSQTTNVFHGPHPSDPSKWRVMWAPVGGAGRLRVRVWITVLGE